MNKDFETILSCVPLDPSERINWSILEQTALSGVFTMMDRTPQNPEHHGEGNVGIHTRAVCEQLVRLSEYHTLPDRDKQILFVAALLHDIGKIKCTKTEDGIIISPHHASVGAIKAREWLWRDLGLCGSKETQGFRESVCNLIRYHSFPPHAVSRENGERSFQKIASNGELADGFSVRKLCLLEKADVLGRISGNNDEWLENIEYCLMLAEDFECADAPFSFPSDFTKRAYFKGKTDWKKACLYDDSWGEVILMSGLPGTGKDTWIRENLPNMPMVSLDEWRVRLGISPVGNQGAVVAAAKEQAREYLRKKQPFVWNATNLTAQLRSAQIDLFEDYGACVRTIFLETEWDEQLRRNEEREACVPQSAIENMLAKTVLPERHESAWVEWKMV